MPMTISEAIGIFERAFRARDPNEIERVLRENLNVQVAVIESKESAENKINEGYYPLTIRVPYWIFVSKVKEKGLNVYSLEQENIISDKDKRWKLDKIHSYGEILPNRTYFLLKNEAGYYPDLGLTFEGDGEVTGFEKIDVSERAEKFGVGREQTWEEHAVGALDRANRILEIYKSFLIDWAKNVFSNQNLKEEEIKESVNAIILAIKIAVFFHDIGKLRREWQEAVGWRAGEPYIARTSTKQRVPFHAPYAYPFLITILRTIFGEYRFLDVIALAVARHHSLEVTGAVKKDNFQLADERVIDFLSGLLLKKFPELSKVDTKQIIQHAVEETNKGSVMDEPPSPSDDFYFLYTIANRVVKLADWEDAGNKIIELPERLNFQRVGEIMIPKIHLKRSTYKVYKTGLPFYDAARLIGVAHLFFGTASAEIEDKGAYWEVKGIDVKRDEKQISWVLKKFVPKPRKTKKEKIQKPLEYKVYKFIESEENLDNIRRYFLSDYPQQTQYKEVNLKRFELDGKRRALKAEYDAGLQSGTRGWDPLSKYEFLTTRMHGKDKILIKPPIEELSAATLGRGFAASVVSRTKRQREEMYILPIFSSHVVLSGFLYYERFYQHSAGGFVASVLAAISILLDLTSKKIPVDDFAYTKEVKGPQGLPISSESGYLGFEKLCNLWNAVKEEDEERLKRLRILRQIKSFLENTARQDIDSQNQALTRHLANFAVNLDVDSLCMIERLKARILASQEGKVVKNWALNLFKSPKDIKEVKEMIGLDLPDVPKEVSQALAKALELDEKGWMNQFTRLENATDFSQFISYVEHIISRGYYRELQKKGQPSIRNAMNQAGELASTLKCLSKNLADEKKFRAWKSIFLMDVLSRMKFEGGE